MPWHGHQHTLDSLSVSVCLHLRLRLRLRLCLCVIKEGFAVRYPISKQIQTWILAPISYVILLRSPPTLQ